MGQGQATRGHEEALKEALGPRYGEAAGERDVGRDRGAGPHWSRGVYGGHLAGLCLAKQTAYQQNSLPSLPLGEQILPGISTRHWELDMRNEGEILHSQPLPRQRTNCILGSFCVSLGNNFICKNSWPSCHCCWVPHFPPRSVRFDNKMGGYILLTARLC